MLKSLLFYISLFIILALAGCSYKSSHTDENTFSYNIPIAPQTFDPILQTGTNARYLLNNLYLTLLKWDKNNQLTASGAKSCDWSDNKLTCKLKDDLKFQDGTPIQAIHYIHSLNLLKKNQTKKTLDFKNISYAAVDKLTLQFTTLDKNYDLKNQLTLLEISPRKKEKFYKTPTSVVSSTDYYVESYAKNQHLILKSKTHKKLQVKIYFIEDQSTALRLYQTKQLSLLTMVPQREIAKYSESEELFFVPMVRMDGLFFNPKMQTHLKKAFFHAAPFEKLKDLYRSKGTPGCPALHSSYFNHKRYCYKFDLKKAKNFLAESLKLKNSSESATRPLKLSFSSLGGDDIQRGMEWFAHEWQKNLGLKIAVDPLESGVFLQNLRSGQFDIIRKGIPLDAPHCLEALSSFHSKDPNNAASLKSTEFDQLLDQMKQLAPTSGQKMSDLCERAMSILHKNYTYLPLGPMYFSYLQNGKFKGWFINSLNILDLENLESKN